MAVGFTFRLETVRRLRQEALDRQRRAVAEAMRSAARVDAHLAALQAELRHTLTATGSDRRATQLDVGTLRAQQLYRGWLQRQMLDARGVLAARQEKVDAERVRLAEAVKQVKVIEKLRERQWDRYRRRLERAEQQQTDEVALRVAVTTGSAGRMDEGGC